MDHTFGEIGTTMRGSFNCSGDPSLFHSIKEKLSLLIKLGDLQRIKSMFTIQSKDEIDSAWKMNNFDYVSPIHEAAEYGRDDVLQLLLSPPIAFDINELTSHGSHILHLAAYRGLVSTVQLIVEQYNISPDIRTNESQCTPLILASRNGHEPVVRLLLEKYGANLEMKDDSGSTALHRAAGWEQPHIVRYLVEEWNAEMETPRFDDLFTCLILTAYYGKLESAEMLLNLGANIEALSFDGRTAAHIAMDRGNYEVLELLIRRGANIDYISKEQGCCVRDMARFGSQELRECLVNGLYEYQYRYQQIQRQLQKHSIFIVDIDQVIMDFAYPIPVLFGEQCVEMRKCKGKKRRRSNRGQISWSGSNDEVRKKRRFD